MAKKNIYLILILVVIFISTIIEQKIYNHPDDLSKLVSAVIISFLLFSWCIEHAKFYKIELPRGSALWAGLIAFIGVPVYFFRGFGFKDGLLKTFKAIGFLIILLIDLLFALWVVDDPIFHVPNIVAEHTKVDEGFKAYNDKDYK